MAQSTNGGSRRQSVLRNWVTSWSPHTIISAAQRTSGWTLALAAFLTGTLLGAPGGLLLGYVEVFLLDHWDSINIQQSLIRDELGHKMLLSSCVGISILSSTAGILAGIAVYSQITDGERAAGRALAVAGPFCLMAVSAAGAVLGTVLFRDMLFGRIVVVVLADVCGWFVGLRCLKRYGLPLFSLWTMVGTFPMNMSLIVYILHYYTFYLPFTLKAALKILSLPLLLSFGYMYHNTPFLIVFYVAVVIFCFILTAHFIVADFFILDFPKMNFFFWFLFSTILPPQLLTAVAGMFVFDSWQKGGAVTICLSAALCGAAVLGPLKLALSVLGPGPCVGATMGVMGAVGVSLAAARTAAEQYSRTGTVGVMLGAAVGAFVAACSKGEKVGVIIAFYATFPLLLCSCGYFFGARWNRHTHSSDQTTEDNL